MKSVMISVLLSCACFGLVLADSPKAPSEDLAINAIKQIEQDMGKAMIAGDLNKLSQIYADDFATFGSSGEITTKHDLMTDLSSFHDKLLWFETGPMDVQVFGNVAVAQGSVKEKRNRNGNDTSGQFLWMDLLERRGGRWVVVRSAGARVIEPDSPEAQSSGAQSPGTQAEAAKAIETIKQFEQDLGDAMVAVDIDKINQSYADDWASLNWASKGSPASKIFTKQNLLSGFKSGGHKLVSFAIGPMEVQVQGNLAVVHASVTEKKIQQGKDVSGQFVFMDLLENRAGKWMIVRTLGARVK